MTGSPVSGRITWNERINRAVEAWRHWSAIPVGIRMDRVFKEAGVRDLIVERDRFREALIRCAEAAGEDGEMVEAARTSALTYPPIDEWALACVGQLRSDYDEALQEADDRG